MIWFFGLQRKPGWTKLVRRVQCHVRARHIPVYKPRGNHKTIRGPTIFSMFNFFLLIYSNFYSSACTRTPPPPSTPRRPLGNLVNAPEMVSCLRPINVGNCYVFPVPPPPLWLYCIPVLPGFQSVHLLCSTLCTLSKISNDQ